MQKKLEQIKSDAAAEINMVSQSRNLEELKVRYLGKKSIISVVLKDLGTLPADQRPLMGKVANEVRSDIAALIEQKEAQLLTGEKTARLLAEKLDVTLPGKRIKQGTTHPLNMVLEEVTAIFKGLGYSVAQGPEIETDFFNFEALNIPKNHPSRDMHDTFYFNEDLLLRTHTSPVQVHVMLNQKPPVKIIAPGRVYRRDADITHSPVFHQIEGLYVDKGVTFSDLKGTLEVFLKKVFGASRKVRFRPSFFPFTEPSAEVDVECMMCAGKGCRLCKQTGWIEILGSGMVDSNVYDAVGYDKSVYTGFAFGMGLERITMLKYGIDNIKLFFDNDMRFLKQF